MMLKAMMMMHGIDDRDEGNDDNDSDGAGGNDGDDEGGDDAWC